jgi:hypothetical protein
MSSMDDPGGKGAPRRSSRLPDTPAQPHVFTASLPVHKVAAHGVNSGEFRTVADAVRGIYGSESYSSNDGMRQRANKQLTSLRGTAITRKQSQAVVQIARDQAKVRQTLTISCTPPYAHAVEANRLTPVPTNPVQLQGHADDGAEGTARVGLANSASVRGTDNMMWTSGLALLRFVRCQAGRWSPCW